MSRYFNIENINGDRRLYVTILSYEMTHLYWDELVSAIKAYNKPNVPVYFDYLYRNGLSNRFFVSKTDAQCCCSCDLRPHSLSQEETLIFDRVYAANMKYIETSALTRIQKRMYIRKVLAI